MLFRGIIFDYGQADESISDLHPLPGKTLDCDTHERVLGQSKSSRRNAFRRTFCSCATTPISEIVYKTSNVNLTWREIERAVTYSLPTQRVPPANQAIREGTESRGKN